jgi:hypothetical protein
MCHVTLLVFDTHARHLTQVRDKHHLVKGCRDKTALLREGVCVGLARTIYIRNYDIYVILAGKSPNTRHIRCIYTVLANPMYVSCHTFSI